MVHSNGQIMDAILAAKAEVRDEGVHYDSLYQDTKLLLYVQDWAADRIIDSITPKINTLVHVIGWSAGGISASLLANVAWEATRFFFLH